MSIGPLPSSSLKFLGGELGLPVYDSDPEISPVALCRQALEEAKKRFADVLLIDTAGRLHIDEELMQELAGIKDAVRPHQILFVADAMTGQDAVNQAMGFDGKLGLSGVILTKLDGDARGGAALSIREMVGKPILFSGVGEKLEALEPFYPDRLASRILGMGDVLSLIDKVQQNVEEKEAARLQKAFQKQQFTLEEFQLQLQQIKRMGSMSSLLEMIPGGKKLASQVDARTSGKRNQTGGGDHQFDDPSGAAQSGDLERQPPPPHRRRQRHHRHRCQPVDETVHGNEKNDAKGEQAGGAITVQPHAEPFSVNKEDPE